MKKYKLIRSALFTCIASLALTTTGCSTSQKDNLKDAYDNKLLLIITAIRAKWHKSIIIKWNNSC